MPKSHLLSWLVLPGGLAGLPYAPVFTARCWHILSSLLPSWLMQSLTSGDASMADTVTSTPDLVRPDGPLHRLRSRAEVNASGDTIEVYIAEVPPKATKTALDAMKPLLPEDHKRVNLAHLRRPCTLLQLPEHLQIRFCPPGFLETILTSRRKKGGQKWLYVLMCATCLVEEEPLFDAIAEALKKEEYPVPKLHRIPVPQFAPTTPEQAEKWSAMYWPTSYKNNNPYGPNPSFIARAETQLMEPNGLNADRCMQLARQVASESRDFGLGEPVGVVIVQRSPDHGARIVAVASDARFRGVAGCEEAKKTGGRGNIAAHAVLRAIGLTAQKRRIIDGKADPPARPSETFTAVAESSQCGTENASDADENDEVISATSPISPIDSTAEAPSSLLALLPAPTPASQIFLDLPMTESERKYFDPPTLLPKGYLCLDLELYTTHEPCIMCSMAILHSRFGRVVFEKEMRSTGALVAERPPIEPPTISIPRSTGPAPTKSAKRRRNRKNSKMRALALKEAQAAMPMGPAMEYGLWWRSQLNWKFLCWQWRPDRVGLEPGEEASSDWSTPADGSSAMLESHDSQHVLSGGEGPSSMYEDELIKGIRFMTVSDIDQLVHV